VASTQRQYEAKLPGPASGYCRLRGRMPAKNEGLPQECFPIKSSFLALSAFDLTQFPVDGSTYRAMIVFPTRRSHGRHSVRHQ
jgi:hypothetical protein